MKSKELSKARLSNTTRKFIISLIYFVCALLAIINLALTGSDLNYIDLALTSVGVIAWSIAATQGLINKWLARKKQLVVDANPDGRSIEDGKENIDNNALSTKLHSIRGSTHSTINSVLHMLSSSSFLVSDARYLKSPTPILITRICGSFLWLKSASLYCWMARNYERKQEDNSIVNIKYCGLNVHDIDFIGNVEYLASAFCYAGALWANNPISSLRAAGNICWIIAGTHDTVYAFIDMRNERKKALNVEMVKTPSLFYGPEKSDGTPNESGVVIANQSSLSFPR